MRKLMAILLAALLVAPATALAATSIEELQKKIEELTDEVDYLSGRVDKTEKHTALDRIEFSGDLRAKADTLHYKDVTNVQPPFINGVSVVDFSAGPPGTGWNLNPDGTFKRETKDLDNDILYTTRLRLNMKAKVYDNVNFAGRLAMYKNWGDSTGSKVFDSWSSFTMDGTDGGNTTGDWLRVERAYFDWNSIGGSNFYLSIGRRPSTYGPPSQYRENELRGGTPSGHLVHFNFDGITIGYKLSDLTGIEGQTIRFCYGQGYESEYGNGELFNQIDLDDTHLGGFNIDALNDGTNFLQLTLFMAKDVTDGFKGVFAVPTSFLPPDLAAQMMDGVNLNARLMARENIGDIILGGIGFAREEMNGINWFGSLGWTRMDPNGKAGMFGGLISDPEMTPIMSTENPALMVGMAPSGRALTSDTEDGYGVYAGVQFPAPLGKFGLEYNYGSEFWTPFTQAQDDVMGSKLATRGHVGEAYYIFEINPNMFIKVGGIYYDYEYTGSGSPVGKPQKVEDVMNGTAYSMLPVVDKAWDGYASLTVKF